jgi:hypothetical protein
MKGNGKVQWIEMEWIMSNGNGNGTSNGNGSGGRSAAEMELVIFWIRSRVEAQLKSSKWCLKSPF